MIAFFGMGLLGSNFARALRRRGEEVRVWNRTPARAKALEADGARAFADPAEAARGAARIHLTLSDDAAVDDVLERARPGFAPGVTIVDHTTTSVVGTAERAKRWAERGVAFAHAPVFMGPQNALEGTGIMMISGDPARHEALAPALAPMTGKLVYVGPQPERAAAMKLLGNSYIIALNAGLTGTLALGKALGVPPADVVQLFDGFNPGASTGPRLRRLIAADYAHPTWELAMARKDARLMIEAAARAGIELDLINVVATRMDELIARGHGHDDWTILAQSALP